MIQEDLFDLQDINYKEFHKKLIPNIDETKMIGIRVPVLRKYAKKIKEREEGTVFLDTLPHTYYEENMLHGILLSEIKAYDVFLKRIEEFLPYIDNWAVCDSIKPKSVEKHLDEFIYPVKKWIRSKDPYTIRFGINMLMTHYLEEASYKKEYVLEPLKVQSNDYYVEMGIAWFYATSLAKQYKDTIVILENGSLESSLQNKTIQKAIESYRISKEQKQYLKTLKRKKEGNK